MCKNFNFDSAQGYHHICDSEKNMPNKVNFDLNTHGHPYLGRPEHCISHLAEIDCSPETS